MIRLLVEFLLPLVAPTIVYAFWLAWRQGRQAQPGGGEAGDGEAGAPARGWGDAPWLWLGGTGIVLVAVVTIWVGSTRSLGEIGGSYVAPRVVDGRIVPGHVDPPPQR